MSTPACRMCLAVGARLCTIANTPLQDVYERITDVPLLNGDRRPERVCYLCHHLLRKHQAFMEKSVKADELLRFALDRGIELTEASIRLMGASDFCSSLGVSCREHLDIISQEQATDLETLVKAEPADDADTGAENDEMLQNDDRSIRSLEAEIDMMIQDTSGYIKDEDEAVDTNEATPSEDDMSDLRTSDLLTSECPDSAGNGRTAPKQWTPTDALDGARDCDVTEITSNFILDIGRSSGTEHETSLKQSLLGVRVSAGRKLDQDIEQSYNTRRPMCGFITNDPTSECCEGIAERTKPAPEQANATEVMRKVKQEGESSTDMERSGTSPQQQPENNFNSQREAFTQKSNLTRHRLTHTGEKLHRCSYCDKAFTKKSNLNTHMLIHTGEKPHRCSHCNKAFCRKQDINRHMLIHTGEKPHRCSHCDKAFALKQQLIFHIMSNHTGEKPHRCIHCNKAFTQKQNLNSHIMSIHTGEKPHRCSQCDKAFTLKRQMISHMAIHTGEKPYRCSHCNKAFTQKKNLYTHMSIHSGEKPHRCSDCNKAFTRKQDLNTHMLIHTGVKPHRCSHCNRAFTQKQSLNTHMLIHTK